MKKFMSVMRGIGKRKGSRQKSEAGDQTSQTAAFQEIIENERDTIVSPF